MDNPWRVAAALIAIASYAAVASAQSAGNVSGVVRDTSGGVLPGVSVTVNGLSWEVRRTANTDERGMYQVDNLPHGRYHVTAAVSGFEPVTAEVDVGDSPAVLDLVMAVSSFSEKVTVTATRTGVADIEATPVAMTAFPARTLEQMGVQTVDGLAGFAPGVTISQSSGGNALVSIRGIGTNSFVVGADPSSTIYLDGTYLGRPAMSALDFLNVERVEILRGPQGSLYGRNSVGGAIHIVTRQPTNVLEANARLTAGNYRKLRADAAVSGPLIKDKVMGNIAFLAAAADGFVRDLDHPDHALGSDDSLASRGQLRVIIGNQSELLLSGDYARFEGIPLSLAKPIATKPGFSFDNPASLWAVRTSHLTSGKNIQEGISAKLAVRLNASTSLTSLTAFRESNYRFFFDADATELPVVSGDVPDLQRQLSQELTVVRRGPKLMWIGGAFLFGDHNEGQVEISAFPSGSQTRLFPRIGTSAWALFGEATYSMSKLLSVTGGIRYTDERKDIDNTGGVYQLGTTALADPTSFYDYVDRTASSAWAPKGAVQVHVSSETLIYASATRGFKSGGFNTSARVPGKAFGPEFAWSYEGGLKTTTAHGRIRTNTAVFYNDLRDLQVLSAAAPGVLDITNAGSAIIKGVEVELTATGRRVQLGGAVSWLDATYKRYSARGVGATTVDASGKRLNNAPEWAGNVSAVYQFATSQAWTASARADVSWQSRVFFTPANDGIETQGAYGLVHLRAGFEPRSDRWEMAVYVHNAANRPYITATSNSVPNAFTARPGEPLRWGTQFTIRR
jgi:iron complex outermembrane recepter protein